MATPAQLTANRANAQKSTGPRSAEGKSASRFNALKHGLDAQSVIIPGEDPAAYDALAADYRAEWQPTTPSDNFHVDTMIRADWNPWGDLILTAVWVPIFRPAQLPRTAPLAVTTPNRPAPVQEEFIRSTLGSFAQAKSQCASHSSPGS